MLSAFAKNVKRIRREKGLTQRDLAKLIGYKSVASVSKLELGKEIPHKKVLDKFAKALDVDIYDLTRSTLPFVIETENEKNPSQSDEIYAKGEIPEEPANLSDYIEDSYNKTAPSEISNEVSEIPLDEFNYYRLMDGITDEHRKNVFKLIAKYHKEDILNKNK